jgi:hypothetical protein
VYADAGQGSQLAALAEAITAGRHDGVFRWPRGVSKRSRQDRREVGARG